MLVDRNNGAVAEGPRGGAARSAIHQRHFAQDPAGPHRLQDVIAVNDLHLARLDDVHVASGLALPEQHVSRLHDHEIGLIEEGHSVFCHRNASFGPLIWPIHWIAYPPTGSLIAFGSSDNAIASAGDFAERQSRILSGRAPLTWRDGDAARG